MIETRLFASGLATELRGGNTETVDNLTAAHPYHRVTGRLDIGVRYASVEIWIWDNVALLRSKPPQAWCHESWMRDDQDWHNRKKRGMCWVLEQEWADGLDWSGKPLGAVLMEARHWMLPAVRQLIVRHYLGYRKDLKKWPKEWDSWGHFSKGDKEYAREQRRKVALQPTRPTIVVRAHL